MLRLKWFAVIILTALISGAGAAAAESVQISINKVNQKMTVAIDGVQKYVWLVSTGAPGGKHFDDDGRDFGHRGYRPY